MLEARQQLLAYPNVRWVDGLAEDAHHRPDGFQNIDPAAHMPRPFAEFLRWQRERRLELPEGFTPEKAPKPVNGESRVKFGEKFKNNLIDLFKEEDELLNK